MQLFSPITFRKITGEEAPPTPITAKLYATLGYPLFKFEEEESGIAAEGLDDILKSYEEMEWEYDVEGREYRKDGEEIDFTIVRLNEVDRKTRFRPTGRM